VEGFRLRNEEAIYRSLYKRGDREEGKTAKDLTHTRKYRKEKRGGSEGGSEGGREREITCLFNLP